jgi:hypothetical protein
VRLTSSPRELRCSRTPAEEVIEAPGRRKRRRKKKKKKKKKTTTKKKRSSPNPVLGIETILKTTKPHGKDSRYRDRNFNPRTSANKDVLTT